MHPGERYPSKRNRPSTKPAVGGLVPEVTMSLEEYFALIGRDANKGAVSRKPKVSSPPKRSGKKDPKMARALRKANSMGRKKSGGFKKGWSQGKIMKKAHQLKRRM
jgi:hypothetical protein